MSEVTRFEALIILPGIILFILPFWPVSVANRRGVVSIRHLINRYVLWLIVEMVVLVAIGLSIGAINKEIGSGIVVMVYVCMMYAILPIYGALAINVIYMVLFLLRKKYTTHGCNPIHIAFGKAGGARNNN